MGHWFFQLWAGGFFLANKVFLMFAERSRGNSGFWAFKALAWGSQFAALPAAIAVLAWQESWILFWLDVGIFPATAWSIGAALKQRVPPNALRWFTFTSIPFGLGWSFWNSHGLFGIGQTLEIASGVTFLVGSDLLTRNKRAGHYWFLGMNLLGTAIVAIGGNFLFAGMQVASVILAIVSLRLSRLPKSAP